MNAETQNAVARLLSGDGRAWEAGYYSVMFNETMPAKVSGAHMMRYEYKDRSQLYKYMHDKIVRGAPVDYLEFGVFRGDSMRAWLEISPHPESRFFGFDSFEGLPEDWETGQKKKGDFATDGAAPDISDPRVSFFKGWFSQTVVPFLDTFAPNNKLVIHMDADLFTSSLYVLMTIDKIIRRGSAIIFDDFNPMDDFAALYHYSRSCGRNWRVVAAREGLGKLGIVIC